MKTPSFELPKDTTKLPVVAGLIETFGWSPVAAIAAAIALVLAVVAATVWVIRTNPPRTIVMITGPTGSMSQRWAETYQKELETHGVHLEIRASGGSADNLEQLLAPHSGVDVGFVSSGLGTGKELTGIASLGTVAYQPLWVFCRMPTAIVRLSELAGKRIAIGAPKSGTRELALALLKANDITGAPTVFSDLDADAAAQALLDGKLDALFLMGESTPVGTVRNLVRAPNVQMYNFAQADAYIRRLPYLTKLSFPEGSIDLGRNLPSQNMTLIGPTIELVARADFNSALSDLLLEVAKDVHGKAGLLQKRGEFPAPLEHDFPLSDDAQRYYKSGKGFLYRTLNSFWIASLINRMLVAVVPLALVVIPAIRLLPTAYRFRIQLRFYRLYRPLLRIEHEAFGTVEPARARDLLDQLESLHASVNLLRVPASFASQYYDLRNHIGFVRERLRHAAATAKA